MRVLIVCCALVAIGSCVPMIERRKPDSSEEDVHLKPRCGCKFEDKPVCGEMPDGHEQDFDNRCMAGCAGAKNIKNGHCMEQHIPDIVCGCPPSDEPVCGKLHGEMKTFRSHCQAGCDGATDITDGSCAHDVHPPVDHPPVRLCGCPPIDDPVCATTSDGALKTFSNRCQAGCSDATNIQPGACKAKRHAPCACNRMLAPVCATMPDGSKKGFSNNCMAECEEAVNITNGPCQHEEPIHPPFRLCGCQPIDAPVCAKDSEGVVRTFGNRCQAGCALATDIKDGAC